MEKNNKKTAGSILLAIGIWLLVTGISFTVGALTSGKGELDRAFGMASGFAAFGAFGIGSFFILIGIILFFKGRNQAKKR